MDTKIPGYQILQPLGRGGAADVYLAIQECLKREVALKILRPIDDNSEARSRFQREGESIANLAHNHIVTVYDMGIKNDKYYIAMEYLSDGTLKELIQQQTCTLAQKINMISQISAALGYAHQKQYVHRDVKPANILFHADGRAILTDFGITKVLYEDPESGLTHNQTLIGTCQYMSPEQANGNNGIDTRSDIYSLGIVFFEMLTGSPPYESASPFGYCYLHNSAPIPTLPESLQRFQTVINKALAKHPDQRYQTTEDFTQDILSLAETNNPIPEPKRVIPANLCFNDESTTQQLPRDQLSMNLDSHESDDHSPSPPAKPKTKLLLGYGSLFAIVALIGIGFYGFKPNDPIAKQSASASKDILQQPAPSQPMTESPNDIVSDNINLENTVVAKPEISQTHPTPSTKQLLAQAKTFVNARQYQKAAEQYQSVLALEPDNIPAKQGLKTVTDQIVLLVNKAFSQKNLQLTLQYIDEGLNIQPKHPLLNKLKPIVTASANESLAAQ